MKQQLIEDIQQNGRLKSWFEYAIMYNIRPGGTRKQRTKAANDVWRNYLRKQKRKKKNKLAKVLIFDIETAPLKAWVWSAWNNNLYNQDMIEVDQWLTLSWSAKWLHTSKLMNAGITPKEIKKENDKQVISKLWKLFDEADIVIAHNAWKFDIRMMNGRFLKHGLNPPSPYKVIDTLKVAKRMFRLPKYNLDYLCQYLGIPGKIKTDASLWVRVMSGEPEAMKEMLAYNDQDVIPLEQLYLKLRPWIPNHPNVNLFLDLNEANCPTCGSDELLSSGEYTTAVNKYDVLQCQNCGANSRKRKNNADTKKVLKSI